MHGGILVAGEADVADLARLLRLLQRFEGPVCAKETVGVLHPDGLVVLQEVDRVRLQTLQGFDDLPGRGSLRAPVELRHEENALSVAIAESLAHPALALPIVVVPAVIHERDPPVDRAADDADRFVRVLWMTKVIAPEADG